VANASGEGCIGTEVDPYAVCEQPIGRECAADDAGHGGVGGVSGRSGWPVAFISLSILALMVLSANLERIIQNDKSWTFLIAALSAVATIGSLAVAWLSWRTSVDATRLAQWTAVQKGARVVEVDYWGVTGHFEFGITNRYLYPVQIERILIDPAKMWIYQETDRDYEGIQLTQNFISGDRPVNEWIRPGERIVKNTTWMVLSGNRLTNPWTEDIRVGVKGRLTVYVVIPQLHLRSSDECCFEGSFMLESYPKA